MLTTHSRSILASGCFLQILKLADLDGSFRELGGDFEFSAQGFDEILKRAHVHIRAALELGYGGLVDAENFSKMQLRGPKADPSLRSG
jgi:hypothetical protein